MQVSLSRHMWRGLFASLLMAAVSLATLQAQQAPSQPGNVMPKPNDTHVTVSFSSQGEVSDVQQLVLRFSREMVRLGEGDSAAAPATLTCTPNQPQLKGRWIDTTRYAWEAPERLPVGMTCEVSLRTNLKALDGSAVQSAGPWKLSTGGPKIMDQSPYQGAVIKENAVFFLRANAPLDRASVEKHLVCEIKNATTRNVSLLTENEMISALRKERGYLTAEQIRKENWIAFRCGKEPLPNDAQLRIVWGKGITSHSGVASRSDQFIGYTVRPPFTAKLVCTALSVSPDEASKAADTSKDCDPRGGLMVEFSSEVKPSSLKALKLKAGEQDIDFIVNEDEQRQQALTAYRTAPLAENSVLNVSLSAALKDVDGRELTQAQSLNKTIRFAQLPAYVGFTAQSISLPLAPRKAEAAVLPVVVRRAGERVKLQQWQVSGDARNAAAAAYLLKREWTRFQNSSPRNAELLPSKQLANHALPNASTAREVSSRNGPLEFVGLPLNEPGLYLIEVDHPAALRSHKLNKGYAMSTALVQVTNLHIAYKAPDQGTQGAALVWVTALDSGKPVSGAKVTLLACDDARTIHQGQTDAQGRLTISAAEFAALGSNTACADRATVKPDTGNRSSSRSSFIAGKPKYTNNSIITIAVQHGKDLALLDAHNTMRVMPFDAAEPGLMSPQFAVGLLAHTVLDRTLFKAGETINMQHLLRRGTAQGFAVPAELSKLNSKLLVMFNGEKVFEQAMRFDANGSALSNWLIPANAKLGSYYGQVMLGDQSISGFEFQVEEYRAPVYDAGMSGAQQWKEGKAELPLELRLSFLSGGAAAGQAVSVRGELTEGVASPQGYARYQFVDELAPAFTNGKFTLQKITLDAQGKAQRVLSAASNPSIFANARPVTLQSEMQFNDANGETQTIAQPFAIWPRERKLGISAQTLPASKGGTIYSGIEISAVLLDVSNHAVAAAPVKIIAQRAKWKYSSNSRPKLELLGEPQDVCEGKTNDKGMLQCQWQAPDETQNVAPTANTNGTGIAPKARIIRPVDDTMWLLRATSSDAKTSAATTQLQPWQWRYTPSDAVLQVEGIDQRNVEQRLDVDSTAKLLVRSPYEQSTLLLTVEREGVLSSSVHQLNSREHRLDMKVLGNYAPNVTLHARLIRGLHSVPENEFASLMPEAYAPGLTARGSRRIAMPSIMPPRGGGSSLIAQEHSLALRVKPTQYSLKVDVTPAQSSFLPREQAPVNITVRGSDGKPAANARVTLAVVDDALLALKPNATWAVLDAMTHDRYAPMTQVANDASFSWRVRTGDAPDYLPSDEASRLRGMLAPESAVTMAAAPAPAAAGRMMAAKGASADAASNFASAQEAAAGAGNAAPESTATPRSNFSTLAIWKTDVTTDANGKAQVSVPLPDSLTRWRVVAIALHKADQFGTAESSFTTTQPLQIVSGLPLSVRSGDVLTQTLTLRNTSDKAMTVSLTAKATPRFARYATNSAQPSEDTLREMGLVYTQKLSFAANENKLIAWPLRVPNAAEQLTWSIAAKTEDAAIKANDAITVSQTVTAATPVTVRQAMLTQATPNAQVSVAQPKGALPMQGGVSVAWQASLADAALSEVREWMKQYPFACLEQKASKLSVANDRTGWDALMAELPKYLDDKGLPRYFPVQEGSNTVPGSEMLASYLLDISKYSGWSIPVEQRNQMLNALKAALDKKLPEQDWAPLRNDTARLLSLQATLMEAGFINAPQVKLNDADKLPTVALLDWARALLTMPASAERNAQLDDAANLLRSRYDVQGTRLSWRNEERENWWWYMWNGNVAAARTVLVVNQWSQTDATWKKDLPLLVKGLTARQQQGHWGTTTANVWGAIALQTFAKQSEAGAVSGTSFAQLGVQQASSSWSKKDPEPVMLPWPPQGAQDVLKLTHQGTGAPWATVSVLAAMKLDAPTSQGMTIKRSIIAVQQQTKGQWRVGDVMRVRLEMSSAAELTWVVVRDPVPSGATVLGRGLARESALVARGQGNTGYAWPVYEERAAESYRGYYARVPRGNWSAEYTIRLNNAGKFAFPASRVEAMYAPEIFAEAPIETLEVKP